MPRSSAPSPVRAPVAGVARRVIMIYSRKVHRDSAALMALLSRRVHSTARNLRARFISTPYGSRGSPRLGRPRGPGQSTSRRDQASWVHERGQ